MSGHVEITHACICCGACIDECPKEAIIEGDQKYAVDTSLCDGCAKCIEICPVDAIQKRE